MSKPVSRVLWFAVLSLLATVSTSTQVSAGWFWRNCHHCQRPVNQCNCQSHQPMIGTQSVVGTQPVIETQMIPQQVTTYRTEVSTQYRQEAFTQIVPVTTYRDVIVDEGSYQTVYVPKHVIKRIPQVSYQQQTVYRNVPYQVTQQVPQVITQMVPRQIVRNQSVTYQTPPAAPVVSLYTSAPTTVGCVGPVVPLAASACCPCVETAVLPAPAQPTLPTMGQPSPTSSLSTKPVMANPVTMLPPTTSNAELSPEPAGSTKPVPDPKFLESPGAVRDSWSTVESRHRPSSNTTSETRTAKSDGVLFRPAQSIFRNWESQSRIAATETTDKR